MRLPPADLPYLREQLLELAAQVRDAWDASDPPRAQIDSPTLLRDALSQLIDMLGHVQEARLAEEADPAEINTLGEYGLHLLDELAQLAAGLDQPTLATRIEQLCLPFALWIARQGGEIRSLGPVVNALAHYANAASHPQTMAALYTCCCELIEAASPACEEQASQGAQPHPWRLLLLNRAIVATRSHNPELMEAAFDAIVEHLPEEARRFFAEGMEQMAIIDYPDPVRDVVRRYFLAHGTARLLH
jgi:hypothetical protein